MFISIRRLGEHRGAPRLYLDTHALTAAGFSPGTTYRIECSADSAVQRLTLTPCASGDRRVSCKRRGNADVPVVDLNSTAWLGRFAAAGAVRVVVLRGAIHVLAVAGLLKAAERSARLADALQSQRPLRAGSLAFGIGITSQALHAGLQAEGVAVELAVANELCGNLLDLAQLNNRLVDQTRTLVLQGPMQEIIADDWLRSRLPTLELLEIAIPCSGASRAGKSKRGLVQMEDHPDVGHLVAAMIQWVAALQPTILFAECTPDYQRSASAAILRAWLRDAGYGLDEAVLDARDFGSLEARVRWFMVAFPPQLDLSLNGASLAESNQLVPSTLSDVLDDIANDDPRWRAVEHLKSKQRRDRSKGNGFKMQLLTTDACRVPTLRAGYAKAGSTDPRLLHPTDPARSRLLTGAEHARIKGIDPALLVGTSDTLAHRVCGQSVDTRPVHALGRRLGQALLSGTDVLGAGLLACSRLVARLS